MNKINRKREAGLELLKELSKTVKLPETQHDFGFEDLKHGSGIMFSPLGFRFISNESSVESDIFTCICCEQAFELEWDIKENEVRNIDSECTSDEKVRCEGIFDEVDFEVNFPTGEIICTDWIRNDGEVFELDEWISVNSDLGVKNTIQLQATQNNMHHVLVGNTMPNVYLDGDEITVARKSKHEKIGSICTDLWWATIIDKSVAKEELTKALGKSSAEYILDEYETAHVKPGVYKCTYYGRDYNNDDSHVYSKLVWDRESR